MTSYSDARNMSAKFFVNGIVPSMCRVHLDDDGAGGGCVVFSGSVEDLRHLAERILDVIPKPTEERTDDAPTLHTLQSQPHGEPVATLS
jgi:hypothetical protein